jgi:hypothetical protein
MSELDASFAILKPSRTDKGMKIPAARRPAREAAPHFRDALRRRLALSADTLAHLWEAAWENAGRPNLSGYQSNAYPVQPEFIKPDY